MKNFKLYIAPITVAVTFFASPILSISEAAPVMANLKWQTVVNNGDDMPTVNCIPESPTTPPCRKFNSYNQPSLNEKRLVVFRARSKGGKGGEPVHGVYTRDMSRGEPIVKILDRETLVPQPNNLNTLFVEPPSFPRIDMDSRTIATRGNHQPVWEFTLPDGSDSRAGTTGIYTNPFGSLVAGTSKLGAISEFLFYEVPEFPGIPFDVFPGAPAVTKGSTLVFKGNYTLNQVGKTGVYYRDLRNEHSNDPLRRNNPPVVLIANNTHTLIPGTQTVFGSTAPPSAANRQAVFAGFDNEENPTLGGIYLALLNPYKLDKQPKLKTLVSIGMQVPGEPNNTEFNKLGEGVSFDGRYVAFWGAWGITNKKVRLYCPEEGNKDRRAYCMSTASGSTQDAIGWYQEKEIPVNQGIFVHDTHKHKTYVLARTGADFTDFMYWNFSGRSPGAGEGEEGEEDGELARWRSATFLAVSGKVGGDREKGGNFHTVFKARTAGFDANNVYINPLDGIFLRKGTITNPVLALVKTGMDGTLIDPEAVDPDTNTALPVTEMSVEREGFRGNSLAINVSMGSEEAGWAGIYLTRVPR